MKTSISVVSALALTICASVGQAQFFPGNNFILKNDPTGAVVRTQQAKSSDWVDILDFGADPNDSIASGAKIQAAINTLGTSGTVNFGGVVVIPAGTYKCTGTTLTWGAATQGVIWFQPGASLDGCSLPASAPPLYVENWTTDNRNVYGTLTVGQAGTAGSFTSCDTQVSPVCFSQQSPPSWTVVAPVANETTYCQSLTGTNPLLCTWGAWYLPQIVEALTAICYSGCANTTPYTVLPTDSFIGCNATAGDTVANLPAAQGTGKHYTLLQQDNSANTCSLAPNPSGTDTINGVNAAISTSNQFGQLTVVDIASGAWARSVNGIVQLTSDVLAGPGNGAVAAKVVKLHETGTLTCFSGCANTTPYTVLTSDSIIICNAAAGNVVLDLPAANGGRAEYGFIKADPSVHTCTITANGADVINGNATVALAAEYATVRLWDSTGSGGGTWSVIVPQGVSLPGAAGAVPASDGSGGAVDSGCTATSGAFSCSTVTGTRAFPLPNVLVGASGLRNNGGAIEFVNSAGNAYVGINAAGGEFDGDLHADNVVVVGQGIIAIGSAPGISGCGAGTQIGGSWSGSFASGTTGTCTVTLTFSRAAAHGWFCHANDLTTPSATLSQTATNSTTATISGTTVSGDVINFACNQY